MGKIEMEERNIVKIPTHQRRRAVSSLQKKRMESICRCSDRKVGLCMEPCLKLLHT
jgi:hypothetical protein